MKALVEKDSKRRLLVKKYEIKRKNLRTLLKNAKLSEKERRTALVQLQKFPRNASPSRVQNRCVITGRSRGVYRIFKVSRHILRKMAVHGKLSGVKKVSW